MSCYKLAVFEQLYIAGKKNILGALASEKGLQSVEYVFRYGWCTSTPILKRTT